MGAPDFPRRPLADNFFISGASTRKWLQVCQISTSYSSINFRDKEGVPKFNVGAISSLPYLVRWNFYLCSKYLTRSNSVPNFSIVSLCIVQLCEYVFPIGLPLYVPKNGFFGVLRMKMWKYCLLTQKRHYPVWIRVCWCITCQNRFNGLSSRYVERFCVQRRKK